MDVSSVSSIAATATAQAPQLSKEQAAQRRDLIKAADVINANHGVGRNNELVFVLDRASHRAIMQVVDRDTKEVVMQLPPEYVIHLAQTYSE